jgi:hypothetical protein
MVYQGIRYPEDTKLGTLVFQNHVVGCTILANRALLRLAEPQPDVVYMHDWWMALCASAGGLLEMVPRPLVHYRQHGGNQIGAGGFRRVFMPTQWIRLMTKMNRLLACSLCQGTLLRERLAERQHPTREEWMGAFLGQLSTVSRQTRRARLTFLRRYRVACQNPVLTILLYLQMLGPRVR